MPEEIIRRKRRLSSFQIIILGFAGVILLGALLLMLPISTTGGNVTPFNETLFTLNFPYSIARLLQCICMYLVKLSGAESLFAAQKRAAKLRSTDFGA